MSKPERIELDRQLIEVRGRMSRLRACLTVRPNPADLTADLNLEMKFYALVEKDLKAKLDLHDIDNTIREMRSMIASGLSAVKTPSFRTNLLALYDESKQREKLRSMIHDLKDRKAVLRKQVADWKTNELPRWRKVIARIEHRTARRQRIQSRGPSTEKSQPTPRRRIRRSSTRSGLELKMKIAELKSRSPKAPSREICGLLDVLVNRGRKEFVPLESWQKKADGKRSWIELYKDKRTRLLVRAYINKVSPLVLS